MSFCGCCGSRMNPLFTGEFCPNECDLKEKAREKADWDSISWEGIGLPPPDATFDFVFEEDTLDLRPALCPSCGSTNVEPFPNCPIGDSHCVPCGHVFFKR